MEYLIQKKYLRMEYGKYIDLVIINRKKKSKRKKGHTHTYQKFLDGV